MELKLKRIAYRDKYTIGRLFINNVYFCDTLEDVPRETKIANETCIPTGKYKVIISWSNRFKRQMPLIVDVPGFDGIRIHSGNTDKDTSGCPLVGKNTIVGKLTDSKTTFESLFKILEATKEDITIEIT